LIVKNADLVGLDTFPASG